MGLSGRLQDKVALISGAGTGIGAATAARFAAEGATVMLCGRREAPRAPWPKRSARAADRPPGFRPT
ncbi:SDR family NAD(P)-dependent oxidoreductase [Cupriavidus basilensis]